jgi:hypothetical protein
MKFIYGVQTKRWRESECTVPHLNPAIIFINVETIAAFPFLGWLFCSSSTLYFRFFLLFKMLKSLTQVGSLMILATLFANAAALLSLETKSTTCKCYPGEACWPSDADWAALNSSISGRLISTVPLGAPCHDPTYNAAACAAFQAGYNIPSTL